jgi:6-pyruvoyltetrahydropterin/6-carboxytetrahydropterin synthase
MALIRVTKKFHFEAAHALLGYDGPCKHVHGHSYELTVTVIGTPMAEKGATKLGMVMDFGDLKCLIKKNIIDPLDHALLLNADLPKEMLMTLGEPFTNMLFVPYQPTSENMLIDFAQRIRPLLPAGVTLHSMKLRETTTSCAEWYAEDNP